MVQASVAFIEILFVQSSQEIFDSKKQIFETKQNVAVQIFFRLIVAIRDRHWHRLASNPIIHLSPILQFRWWYRGRNSWGIDTSLKTIFYV